MHGFTPADTNAGLAGAQRLTPTAEFVTFSHAANGGSPARSVGVLLTGHGASAFPTAAQFRAARRLRAQTTRRSIARAEKERGRALLVEIGHLAGGVAGGLGPWADALQRAWWRGVPFAVRTSQIRRGRRIVVHEHPFRDDV